MKDSSQNKVEGSTFSFTREELKTYYNELLELFSSKIEDFTGKPVENEYGDYYSYIETMVNIVLSLKLLRQQLFLL